MKSYIAIVFCICIGLVQGQANIKTLDHDPCDKHEAVEVTKEYSTSVGLPGIHFTVEVPNCFTQKMARPGNKNYSYLGVYKRD